MSYAVVSDIHGNLEAFAAVLADIEPETRLLCLGDTVGYGPNPNECVTMLRERGAVTVLGNHDVAAIDDFGTAYFTENAREAIRWTQSVLSRDHAEWLNGLSYELRMPDFLMVHGAPVRYFEYCSNIDAARRAFSATDAPLILVGHTHIAEYYRLDREGGIEQRHMQHGGELRLEPGCRYIANAGSVGQPRDLNPRASYVRYEPHRSRLEWRRIGYPVATVAGKIDAASLPHALGSRLVDGR